MKVCTKCSAELPATVEFFYRDCQKRGGLRPDCKICHNKRRTEYRQSPRGIEIHLKANNKYKKTKKGKVAERKYKRTEKYKSQAKIIQRKSNYKRLYGITLECYEKIFFEQEGKCAICQQAPQKLRLGVDHNHSSGKVRGLLCGPCNLALGHFEKNQEQFNLYLRRYRCGS